MWITNRETGETLNVTMSTYPEKQRFLATLPVDQREELRETNRRFQEALQRLGQATIPFANAMGQAFRDAGEAIGRIYASGLISQKAQDQQRRDALRSEILRVNAGNRRRQQGRRR